MIANRMQTLLALAGVLAAGLGRPAQAQVPPTELFLGFASFHLRPAHGTDQHLNGFSLGARFSRSQAWSLELTGSRQTATEADSVDLLQESLMAGPRYSHAWNDRWQGFAHLQAGLTRLDAHRNPDNDYSNSLVLAPGVGVDFALDSRFALRAQEDYVYTRYAGVAQHNACFTLGVVVKL